MSFTPENEIMPKLKLHYKSPIHVVNLKPNVNTPLNTNNFRTVIATIILRPSLKSLKIELSNSI